MYLLSFLYRRAILLQSLLQSSLELWFTSFLLRILFANSSVVFYDVCRVKFYEARHDVLFHFNFQCFSVTVSVLCALRRRRHSIPLELNVHSASRDSFRSKFNTFLSNITRK